MVELDQIQNASVVISLKTISLNSERKSTHAVERVLAKDLCSCQLDQKNVECGGFQEERILK